MSVIKENKKGQVPQGHNLKVINKNRKNKRAQVTIFIIVAVILIAGVALFFLFRSGVAGDVFSKAEKNPESLFKDCIEDEVYLVLEDLGIQGGYFEDKKKIHFLFAEEGEYADISYLCYTGIDNKKCTNIAPFLIKDMEEQIENSLGNKVDSCLIKIKDGLEGQDYVVEGNFESYDFNVDLIKNKIIFNIGMDLTLTHSGESSRVKNFKITLPTEIYNFAEIALKIANDEASEGDSDFRNYIDYSKDMEIDLFKTSESFSKIYTIQNTQTNEMFRFATRGNLIR